MKHLIEENLIISEYYTEMLKTINKYSNVKKSSIFCNYYNINTANSSVRDIVNVTEAMSFSGIVYDLYENTPIKETDKIINNYTKMEEGYNFSGEGFVTCFTIEHPKINDLLIFNKGTRPLIFRVKSVETSLEGAFNDVNYHKLGIEYTPFKNIEHLKILNHYIFSPSDEVYYSHDKFKKYITILGFIELLFEKMKEYFDETVELYFYYYDIKRFPIYDNKIINNFLSNKNGFKRYFPSYKVPYKILLLEDKIQNSDSVDHYYHESKVLKETHKRPSYTVFKNYDDILNFDFKKINKNESIFYVSQLINIFEELIK